MQDFRSIYTGGSKNVDGQQFGQSQNPIRNFLNNFLLGNAQTRSKMNVYRQENPNDVPKELMDQAWEAATQQFKDMHLDHAELDRIMHEEWLAEEQRMREMEKMHQIHMENAWREEQINYEKQRVAEQAQQWTDDYLEKELQEEFDEAYKESEEEMLKMHPVDEQAAIKSAADDMIETLSANPDPRFQNSKFLSFLKGLKSGALEIKEDQLIKHDVPSDEQLEKNFNEAWQQEEQKIEFDTMNKAWGQEEAKLEETEKIFEDVFQKMNDPEQQKQIEKELEEEYKKMLAEFGANPEDMLSDMWQAQQDKEEQELYGDVSNVYEFASENPYATEKNPLETSLNLSNKGRTKEAILALESHLQNHPNDVNSWRFLGRLHQENDQDRKAVTCLMKAIQIDPKDLDTLLALGVSCTNILDEIHAMNHLKNWMLTNEKYKHVPLNAGLISDKTLGSELPVEEIKAINTKLIETFELARQSNPTDPDLLTSMAVLFFIARDYKSSVNLFNEALKQDPSNYSLWNKLGATLAHLGRTEEAIDAYSHALEVKPNYVRCWVNLGIAHAFKGEFDEAIRLYLNALTMNPTAKHVWGYLQTCFISIQRWDLATKVAKENVDEFRDEFDIMTLDDLTGPDVEYREINEKFLIKKDTDQWIKEFA